METVVDFLIGHKESFFWSITVFVIFVAILLKAAIKPVFQAVQAREEKIERELKESEEAYAKAKGLQAELDKQLAEAEGKISEMLAEGRRDAEASKANILAKAQEEAEQLRTRALRDISAARQAALLEIKGHVAEITTEVAAKVLRTGLAAEQQQQLVTQATGAIEALAGAEAN